MFGFGKKRPGGTTEQTLSDIARGMQHSVNVVQEILEQHYVRMLSRYFDDNNNHHARTITINVSPTQSMEVPLIAIIQPNSLVLQEMTVEMSIRIDETKLKTDKAGADEPSLSRTSFAVSIAPTEKLETPCKGDVIGIVMKFKACDPPEGISRIIDEFTSKVLCRPTEAGKLQNSSNES